MSRNMSGLPKKQLSSPRNILFFWVFSQMLLKRNMAGFKPANQFFIQMVWKSVKLKVFMKNLNLKRQKVFTIKVAFGIPLLS